MTKFYSFGIAMLSLVVLCSACSEGGNKANNGVTLDAKLAKNEESKENSNNGTKTLAKSMRPIGDFNASLLTPEPIYVIPNAHGGEAEGRSNKAIIPGNKTPKRKAVTRKPGTKRTTTDSSSTVDDVLAGISTEKPSKKPKTFSNNAAKETAPSEDW